MAGSSEIGILLKSVKNKHLTEYFGITLLGRLSNAETMSVHGAPYVTGVVIQSFPV